MGLSQRKPHNLQTSFWQELLDFSQACLTWLQMSDFGPKTTFKIVDQIRERVRAGSIKTGEEIRSELRQSILSVLQSRGGNCELQLGSISPGVVLIVGVNGGGKTTTIGKIANKFTSQGAKV